jgi:hypothetical protein
MKAYDGCHVTIQVPVDFGNEKEKHFGKLSTKNYPVFGSQLKAVGA